MGIKQDYIELNLKVFKRLFADKDPERIRQLIESKVKEKFKDPSINLDNNVTGENRDIKLSTLTNWITVEKPVISGNATFYMKPEQLRSPTSNMLLGMKSDRKGIKKSMFAFDPNSYEYKQRDLGQQNLKIIMNADYGGSGTPTAAFYTKYSPPATTLMAQSIITTAAAFFESFLGNNQKFFSTNEFFDWAEQVLSSENKPDNWVKVPSPYQVMNRVHNLFYQLDLNTIPILDQFIVSLNEEERTKLYYTNNLNEFISNHSKPIDLIRRILEKLPKLEGASSLEEIPEQFKSQYSSTKDYNEFISKEMFLNPYSPPISIIKELTLLTETILQHCFVPYLTPDSIEKLNNHKRNTVLLVDTDSNVVNANLFVEFVLDFLFAGNNFGRKRLYNDMICINIIASILSKGIDKILKHYCKLHNFSEANWKEMVMKNEFMFKVFFNMETKKRYTASIALREGHIMIPFKLEIKGMDFIKAGVSDLVSKRFTNIIKDNILFSDYPNLHGLASDIKDFEKEIRQNVKNGGTDFYKIASYKDAKGYKDINKAWQLQVYRGATIWNELYPKNSISSLDRVKLIKLAVKDPSDIEIIKKIDPEIYDKIHTKIFNSLNENIAKSGISVIAVPLSVKTLPAWLTPLVDTDITVSNVMSSFGSVFRVLNFESCRFNTKNDKAVLYSPIIAI